ncbi:MAG: HlyD family efflux transporter periplasmic adaptor subunit [Pseudomonadota bacterium]
MKPLPKRPCSPLAADAATVTPIAPDMDVPIKNKRRGWKRALLGGVALCGAGIAASVYVSAASTNDVVISASRVQLSAAEVAPFAEFAPVMAVLVPEQTVLLDTIEGGRVVTVHVDDGAMVAAGEPIISLANTDLELEVLSREALYTEQLSGLARTQMSFDQINLQYERDLAAASLEIELTRAALDRRLPREETGVPQAEIDRLRTELAHQSATYDMIQAAQARDRESARRNLDQLRVSVGRMGEGLDLMRASLGGLTVSAPSAGQVSGLTLRPGEVISQGARIGQIDMIDRYQFRASIDEFYLGRIAVGQSATAAIGDAATPLHVSKVYPNVDNRRFDVDLSFAGAPPRGLRRGQSVRVRIALSDTEETLTLSNGPYFEETGGLWVYAVSETGDRAEKRPVTLGRRNPERVEVLSGLQPGDRVITSSYDGLAEAETVNIRSSK